MRANCVSLSAVCLLLPFMTGCGGPDVVPVSGKITLDGEPLSGVNVQFNPIASEGKAEEKAASYGVTKNDGRYELRLIKDDKVGAVPGKYRVALSAQEADGDAGSIPNKVPPHERSKEFEVPAEGTPSANFELTSKPN